MAFLDQFQRWTVLFKGKEMSLENEKWLIAEYYRALSFLTEGGFVALTEELAAKHTFFPSIAECLAIANPGRNNYKARFGGDPKYMPTLFRASPPAQRALSAPRAALTYGGDE